MSFTIKFCTEVSDQNQDDEVILGLAKEIPLSLGNLKQEMLDGDLKVRYKYIVRILSPNIVVQ